MTVIRGCHRSLILIYSGMKVQNGHFQNLNKYQQMQHSWYIQTLQPVITCDASDFVVGGVLQQYIDNVWQPLSLFSKKLNPAETRYSAFDRELLAVYATIRHFRHNLEGRKFFVNTDHKPLTFVMSSLTERPSLRQSRQLAFIAEITTDMRYVKGETNFVADALSRPSVSVIDSTSAINYKGLGADQALNAEFTRLRHSTSSTMNFQLLKTAKISRHNQPVFYPDDIERL